MPATNALRDQLELIDVELTYRADMPHARRVELEDRARRLRQQLDHPNSTTNPKDDMPDPTPKITNYSEQDHDDLFAAMYPGSAKPERAEERAPDDGKVRATDSLTLSEVEQLFPDASARDELLLAHKLGTPLHGDEQRAAVVLAAEEDRRVELDETMRGIRRR
jgi:hypothetical protein